MIEFDIQCRLCRTPMTLQVRDERARAAFEKDGALCDVCYELGYRARATTDAAPSKGTVDATLPTRRPEQRGTS
jgi:hypothetical protein